MHGSDSVGASDGHEDPAQACLDGCPPPDTDGDQIPDPADGCPLALETRNGFKDTDGCPDQLPDELAGITGTLRGVRFDPTGAALTATARRALRRVAAVLNRYPDANIEISAHTPSTGDADANRRLSQRQAEVVVDELVRLGVGRERLRARGAGPDEPILPHATSLLRPDEQRRVELAIDLR